MHLCRMQRAGMAVVLLALASPALAQSGDGLDAPLPSLTVARPIQILFGVDGVGSVASVGGDVRFSVSVPSSDRFAIEPFVGVYRGEPNVNKQRRLIGS